MVKEVPIQFKALLTLPEAAEYFNIGFNKLLEITEECNCPYVVFIGKKRLIKRERLEKYLNEVYEL